MPPDPACLPFEWHKFFSLYIDMSLTLYNKKRRFNETPEPKGKEKSSRSSLRFVIQKHDASHLHYDFRLEMEGVLKSWAVPKGPSLNPADKRLAMMVEDHPYDYRTFEGVIPEGNYGGGTVIVWDEGYYEPMDQEGLSKKEKEKLLLRQLKEGNLKIVLHGKKIRGAFALFLMKGRGERSWILMKKEDEFATDQDVLQMDLSVKSGKSMFAVAEEGGTTLNHPELHKKSGRKKLTKEPPIQLLETAPKKAGRKKSSKATTARKTTAGKKAIPKEKSSSAAPKKAGRKKKLQKVENIIGDVLSLTSKSEKPEQIQPMLASLTDEPFDGKDWIFEIKWDGYRALGYSGGNAALVSRNLNSFTEKYSPVTEALKAWEMEAVVDGEIVAVDEKGLAVFQSLQNWQNTPVHLQYCIFDLLWLEGYDLTALPLTERKRILKEVLPPDDPVLKYSDHVEVSGISFFNAALAQGLEGIMAKRADSRYVLNTRTDNWLKVKVNQRQEVVIAGFTEPRNTRKYFGSLLLGLYEGDKLVYVGHTGSGFNAESLEFIYRKLQPLVTTECPFEKCPKGNMPVTWVKPRLVCEIKFTEWTKDRIARHPIFMGLRVDKKPKEAQFEKSLNMSGLKQKEPVAKTKGKAKARKMVTAGKKAAPAKKTASKKKALKSKPVNPPVKKTGKTKTIDLSAGNDQELRINGNLLQVTNLNKLYWKKEGFSKGDMLNYYLSIAPWMMPYMKDRPQSLNRHPNGISGPNFYQKDMKGKAPEWAQTHIDFSESTSKDVEYLVCSNEATLIYMANLGCIEMHPWHSRSGSWQKPDWCLIDLDPDDPNTYEQVMDVARLVKNVLDDIGADAYCKTSGSTGMHIYIPLGARYSYEQSKQLAELVVNLVHQEMPDITSIERSPSKRKGKIYLDYLQNRETQTAAAPYSLRPKPGMPVSTPLDWTELKKGLLPQTWNALNIFDRLKSVGDLFQPVLGKGIQLEKVLSTLASRIK